MAEDTNELSVPIGADPSGLRQGFQEAENIVNRGVSRIESSLSRLSNIGQQLAGLGATLTASITLPIVALAKESIQAYGDLQSLELGLEAVAGSAIYAGKQLGNLREIAKLPGLGLKEAVKGSINLQAIGYSAASSEKILSQFGNAVASVGKGRVEFERAIYGVTQLANTEFPLGEDLNIIKDALPQVSTLLKAAFGTSRTEDLQKLKVSSKQVMDVILTGLEKLPRVNGGIKNAFENLGDSIQQNLARIGKIIDERLNISAIIDKITNALNKIITAFEELNPSVQKAILTILGLAAALGPVILAIGGFIAALPILISGLGALGTALTYVLTLLTPLNIILGVIAYELYDFYVATERASDRQERFSESLAKATINAKNENSELKKLYDASQDQTKSLEERNKAIDQIQKQYPAYFGNLSNESILAGKAGDSYNALTIDILKASKARAASAELDKRNTKRLEEELKLTDELKKALAVVYNPNKESLRKFNKEFLFDDKQIFVGGSILDQVNASEPEIKAAAKKYVQNVLNQISTNYKNAKLEDVDLNRILGLGKDAISKLDTSGVDSFLPGLDKIKKETEKQIAEIFPLGSTAELRQRADLLRKSIETSVGGIVKVRGLDKFGKQTDKKGNPYFTGEILGLEEALNRLEDLGIRAGDIEIQPIKFSQKGLLDQFGQEYKTFNDFMLGQVLRTGKILGEELPQALDTAAQNALVKTLKMEEVFKKANESIKSLIEDSTLDGISDIFATLGESLATGQSALQAIGQSILATLGNFISKFGMELVKTALLSEVFGGLIIAIKNAFGNPYVLLALGAAAIAVGAAVSASAKRTSSTASGGNFSSSAGVSSGNNYTSSYMNGGGGGNNEIRLRVDGRDLVTVLNRNVIEQDRLKAG